MKIGKGWPFTENKCDIYMPQNKNRNEKLNKQLKIENQHRFENLPQTLNWRIKPQNSS